MAVEAHGSTIRDADGREYLDAAGGAIVVNIGHGRAEIARAMADQAGRLAYAHGSAFTTEPLEAYARESARGCRLDDPAIYPVSGGSEAIESSLKLARAYRLARGERDRWIVIARWGATTATRWARSTCRVAGRSAARTRAGWAGSGTSRRPTRIAPASPARRRSGPPMSSPPSWSGRSGAGPDTVAAFVAEPIVGATLAAAVPPDDYWPRIVDVCRRHGVLLIADEVMTGFGRTGRWFGLDHWGVRADLLVAAKGATSGYWPFGLVAASGEVHDTVARAGSSTASRTRTTRWVPRSRARSSRSSNAIAGRGEVPPRASACGRCSPPAWAITRTSARSAAAGC